MNTAARHFIEAAFQITDGPQIVLTSISTRDPAPCRAGDDIMLHAPGGRIEPTKVRAIEYALKTGGVEFYGLALEGDKIPEFGDFTKGSFEVKS